jgi:hypothetical protein
MFMIRPFRSALGRPVVFGLFATLVAGSACKTSTTTPGGGVSTTSSGSSPSAVPADDGTQSPPERTAIEAAGFLLSVCVSVHATVDEYAPIDDALSRPTGRGTEVDLPEGVRGVAFNYPPGARVEIILEPTFRQEQVNRIYADLTAIPVVESVVAGDSCA